MIKNARLLELNISIATVFLNIKNCKEYIHKIFLWWITYNSHFPLNVFSKNCIVHQLKKIILEIIFHFFPFLFNSLVFPTIFIIVFFKSSLNWEVSFIHLKLFTKSFCDITHPYKLFTSQCWIIYNSLFWA